MTARSVGADGCPGPASPPVFLSTPISELVLICRGQFLTAVSVDEREFKPWLELQHCAVFGTG